MELSDILIRALKVGGPVLVVAALPGLLSKRFPPPANIDMEAMEKKYGRAYKIQVAAGLIVMCGLMAAGFFSNYQLLTFFHAGNLQESVFYGSPSRFIYSLIFLFLGIVASWPLVTFPAMFLMGGFQHFTEFNAYCDKKAGYGATKVFGYMAAFFIIAAVILLSYLSNSFEGFYNDRIVVGQWNGDQKVYLYNDVTGAQKKSIVRKNGEPRLSIEVSMSDGAVLKYTIHSNDLILGPAFTSDDQGLDDEPTRFAYFYEWIKGKANLK